jgi:small subunit ribosomal protein S2
MYNDLNAKKSDYYNSNRFKNKMARKKKETEEKEKTKKNKESSKDETILTPLEDYIKTSSYLGTKVITPSMRKYVYRRRLDGLAILNTLIVDKKLKDAIDFINQFKPDEWTLICKREAGWRAVKMFAELTGVRLFTKKYPAGILTNTELPGFFETKMIMICDPWLDKNALEDARKVHIPVVGICDTNNHTTNIDVVIIGNNKSNKSLGLFFWLLTKEYMKIHFPEKAKKIPSLEDFAGEELVLEEPKKKKKTKEKKERELKTEEQKIEEKMKSISHTRGAEEGV